jgi:hypothetical protein
MAQARPNNQENNSLREWLPGQALLNGVPCESQRIRVVDGDGVDTPTIIWTCFTREFTIDRILANEELCGEAFRKIKAEAKANGKNMDDQLKVVVIRQPNHDMVPQRDLVTQLKTQLKVKGDPRITIFMGKSFEDVTLEGHIYVNEKDKLPISIMEISDRKILLNDGKKVSMEFWHITSSPNGRPRVAVGGNRQRVGHRERAIQALPSWR